MRTVISFIVLLTIICSNLSFEIVGTKVSLAFLLLLVFCLLSITNKRGLILYYYTVCSLIISIGYVGFHLFGLFDPVWLIFDRKWMLAFAILYLTLMLIKNSYDRISIAAIGICNGELIYSFILDRFMFPFEIGTLQFLDVFAMLIVLIVIWNVLERLVIYFEANFYRGIKERQG